MTAVCLTPSLNQLLLVTTAIPVFFPHFFATFFVVFAFFVVVVLVCWWRSLPKLSVATLLPLQKRFVPRYWHHSRG